ncbi:hypothetical protein J2045_003404 [Peteryoungia aggregata LMG 23059]|uniref:Uncharacterized protein n=1 Tax=Peteryoungia aggregata LMG 23059 TaxID=1368425 RepID=A0ABU0GAH5_9HYPH|nr:hypothetical protein [Peteryoungia aggregata]MDQ0422356.1 hypothetical protein [Peteryoungia aggregata LMG 23059]
MMTSTHNEKTQQENYEDQQFLKGYADIKKAQSEMAGTKGGMNAIYKRLKDLGWSKKDIEFAMSLEEKDVGQVIADFERKIRIAKLFGHRIGRQMSLINGDGATEADRAYEEGRLAGMLRKANLNPYAAGSEGYDAWQRGNNDGYAFINQDLKAAIATEGPGN